MERLWNIIHYFVHKADFRLQQIFYKVNPIIILRKILFKKEMYEKKGITLDKDYFDEIENIDRGKSSFAARSFMFLLLLMAFSNIITLHVAFVEKLLEIHILLFILFVLLSLMINYVLLFKQAKYLYYFTKFEKMKHDYRNKYMKTTIILVIVIVVVSTFNYLLMNFSLKD